MYAKRTEWGWRVEEPGQDFGHMWNSLRYIWDVEAAANLRRVRDADEFQKDTYLVQVKVC